MYASGKQNKPHFSVDLATAQILRKWQGENNSLRLIFTILVSFFCASYFGAFLRVESVGFYETNS